jgi:hypothetical protein
MSQGLTGVAQAPAYSANVASATTVTLPNAPMDCTYPVTGTTTITSITAGQAGRKARLIFQSANCTVVNGSNLKLAGRSFVSTVNRMLTLVSDGTNWVEESRGEFGTLVPVTQNFGDVAAAGTGDQAADIYHVHGMPPYPAPNALYNGDFSVAQLGPTAAPFANAQAALDGWQCLNTSAAVLTHNQLAAATSVIGTMNLSTYSYINTTTADASIAAGDLAGVYQQIEGYDARAIAANGGAFSGWFYSNVGGTFSISLANRDATWSYIREVVISANTWTYVTTTFPSGYGTISLPGDFRTNRGFYFYIALAAGSTYTTAPNVWTNANKVASTNQTNFVGTISNAFYISGLNLVPGLVPQPFYPATYEQQLARCQRYRQIIATYPMALPMGQAINGSTINGGGRGLLVPMCGTPSATISSTGHFSALKADGSNVALGSLSFTFNPEAYYYAASITSGLVAGNAVTVYGSNGSALVYASAYPA